MLSQTEREARSTKPVQFDKPRVLVIADDPLTRRLFSLMVEHCGIPVLTTGHDEAIACVQRECPQIVMLDTRWHEEDSSAFCRQLKSAAPAGQLGVIAFVDHADLCPRLTEAGADEVFVKPYRVPLVLRRIGEMFASLDSAKSLPDLWLV